MSHASNEQSMKSTDNSQGFQPSQNDQSSYNQRDLTFSSPQARSSPYNIYPGCQSNVSDLTERSRNSQRLVFPSPRDDVDANGFPVNHVIYDDLFIDPESSENEEENSDSFPSYRDNESYEVDETWDLSTIDEAGESRVSQYGSPNRQFFPSPRARSTFNAKHSRRDEILRESLPSDIFTTDVFLVSPRNQTFEDGFLQIVPANSLGHSIVREENGVRRIVGNPLLLNSIEIQELVHPQFRLAADAARQQQELYGNFQPLTQAADSFEESIVADDKFYNVSNPDIYFIPASDDELDFSIHDSDHEDMNEALANVNENIFEPYEHLDKTPISTTSMRLSVPRRIASPGRSVPSRFATKKKILQAYKPHESLNAVYQRHRTEANAANKTFEVESPYMLPNATVKANETYEVEEQQNTRFDTFDHSKNVTFEKSKSENSISEQNFQQENAEDFNSSSASEPKNLNETYNKS